MNEQEIDFEINKWFEENRNNKRKYDGQLGQTLKRELKKDEHWKDRPRGNSKKGYEKYKKLYPDNFENWFNSIKIE